MSLANVAKCIFAAVPTLATIMKPEMAVLDYIKPIMQERLLRLAL